MEIRVGTVRDDLGLLVVEPYVVVMPSANENGVGVETEQWG